MSRSSGQEQALEELRNVAVAAGDMFSVDEIVDLDHPAGYLVAAVTFSCEALVRKAGGLPLEDRELLEILIPRNFPFEPPHVRARHDRFAGFPHVNWNRWLCLYQAPTTEWNAGDGMYGFLDRLYLWLRQAALGELDPIGGALHPPVTYSAAGPRRIVIPRVDAPAVGDDPWFGTAHIKHVSDVRKDIIGWSPLSADNTPAGAAAAVLLPGAFPAEFPTGVANLIAALEQRGVSRDRFFLALQWAVLHNAEDAPLYVIIGAAMRGIRGERLRQHLTAWYVDPILARALRLAIQKYSDDPTRQELGERVEAIILEWAQTARVEWCDVEEDRPEIVTRRDHQSPLAWFAGRTAAVWGCGALGGHVAEYLARAGVWKLILRDNGTVKPGILVRQPFDDADLGRDKVDALRERLLRIRPDLKVETSDENILNNPLGGENWTGDADVVIDATAAVPVIELLERHWAGDGPRVPTISMAIGHLANRGMVVLSLPEHSGGPRDVTRRLKLEACTRPELVEYLNEFWPHERRPLFQPEPGCSDPTFVGSSADAAAMAAILLNRAALDLSGLPQGTTAGGHFAALPGQGGKAVSYAGFNWEPDHVSNDIQVGYQVRIAPPAWREARRWILHSRDQLGPNVETGGLLFGERDDAAGVLWVSELSGPPPDSRASEQEFICGVDGTAELNQEKRSRSGGSIHYLGMWHTHPTDLPVPSPTDWEGMRRLVRIAGGGSRCLLLIIGLPFGPTMLGTYVFRAADLETPHGSVPIRLCAIQGIGWEQNG